MEDSVAFIKPARLRIDKIRKGTARERCSAIGYSFRVEMVDGGGAFRIDQRSFGCDVHRRAQGCDVESDHIFGGKSRMDFDQAVVRGKGFALDPKPVTAERKIAGDEVSGVVGGKGALKLDCVTG